MKGLPVGVGVCCLGRLKAAGQDGTATNPSGTPIVSLNFR